MNIIQEIEQAHAAELAEKRAIPDFRPGDTLRVSVRVTEGERTRVQAYEGVCIARGGQGLNESFTVRKISYGEGVERVFPVYSPMLESIDIVRQGRVRRAKLYYLRERRGKSARIAERRRDTDGKGGKADKGGKAAAASGAALTAIFTKPAGAADDLTRISGVGEVLVEKLNSLGITQFEQVANFSDEDIAKVDEALDFKGRIERENWVQQAKDLMAESTADEAVQAAEDEAAAEAPAEKDASE